MTGSPSGGNGETSDLQKGLQCTVVCEPTRCRRSKHLHHSLHLPTSPVFFFFPKNRYFCWPVLIRANTCFELDRGASVLISTTIQRARSCSPVLLSAFRMSCLSLQNLPGAWGQKPGTESGETLIRPRYPFPGE